MEKFFDALAAHGLPGLVIFGLGAWIVILHRELRDERLARIADLKASHDAMTAMQAKNLSIGEKLSDVMSEIKERDRERELSSTLAGRARRTS